MKTAFFRYRWIELLMLLEKKTRESFLRSVHILIILLYIAFNGLNCVLILCKQHSVSFHILLRRNRVMAKKSLLDVVYIRFCLTA